MKKVLKWLLNCFVFIFTAKGEWGDEMVDQGLCDYSGQGRDRYGH